MANKLDKVIIVDVESTCWEKKTPNRLNDSEIIEIGVCVINLTTLSLEDNEGILVLPQKSTISQFCTDLTTITQEMLEESGIPFKKACSILRDKYNTNNRVWMSWGDYDRRQFERQCSKIDEPLRALLSDVDVVLDVVVVGVDHSAFEQLCNVPELRVRRRIEFLNAVAGSIRSQDVVPMRASPLVRSIEFDKEAATQNPPPSRFRHADARYPFGPTHINMKNLFAIEMGLSREVGMDAALKMLKMELDGTHHRGVDDARNIARIACRILKRPGSRSGLGCWSQ